VASADDLAEENRVLRERIAQLENAAVGHLDPVLRVLVEHAPAFLTVVTPEGRFIACGRVSEAFGSMVGRSMFDFMDPGHHAMVREVLARAAATRQPAAYEAIGFSESGEAGHTHAVRVIPMVDEGQVRGLVLVPLDITERVRLERSLFESEQTMRLAVDAARMGLWRWDMASDTLTWDARTCEVFGVEAAPPSYAHYLQLVHPDDRPAIEHVVRDAHLSGVYPTLEHRLAAGANDERWVLATGKVLKDASGRTVGILGGVLDITDQKRWAVQMQRAERVEALGQLTAGIAHNFNNLLAAILPNVELALRDARESSRPLLAAALDASLQARDLIKSLITLAGRRGPQVGAEPCDPKEVVTRLANLCRLTFPKEIELQTCIEPGTGLVAMPASDLEQVVLNLLLNARDAVLEAPTGPRRIQVLLDSVSKPPGHVRIRVVDTGVGMSAAVRDQIYVPFFTTKSLQRGSGLGLASALSRVREATGQLECQSTLGAGATFTLLLPESLLAPMQTVLSSVPVSGARSAETILVVDDEAMVRNVVSHVLRKQDYAVVEASSAARAREVLREYGARIELILLDQSMPGESGLDAVPSLQQLSAAPIVLFTGLATQIPAGVSVLLEKPARPAELLRVVRECLDAARSTGSSSRVALP
jgi:PAS domain S-box-containing protein